MNNNSLRFKNLLRPSYFRFFRELKLRRAFRDLRSITTAAELEALPDLECLSIQQQQSFLSLISRFIEAMPCDFYLAFGSLLGAATFRGRIPWDDDFDIFCRFEDYAEIKKRFSSDTQFVWYDQTFGRGSVVSLSKVFDSSHRGSDFKDIGMIWPSISLFWLVPYRNVYLERRSCLILRKKHYANQIQLPYENWMLPAPSKYHRILSRSYPGWQRWVQLSERIHCPDRTPLIPPAKILRSLLQDYEPGKVRVK